MVSIAASELWAALKTAEPRTFRSLRIVPLVGPSRGEPSYRLFDPETAKDVEVTEVDDAGDVPNIRVTNRLEDRVLLIDGQELIGAKQNRILNTDVLVPAATEIVIPVSCMEQGRWGYKGRHFSPGKMAYRSARASKSSQVHAALQRKLAQVLSDIGELPRKM